MLNITNYMRNASQNYNEVSPHTSHNDHHQKVYKKYMLEWVWREGTPSTVGGKVNWYSHYGEQSYGICGRGRGWEDLGEWH